MKFETTSNLLGLLNLQDYIKDYGPLRLYWEGGYKGEGLLRLIKPMINQGVHKSSFGKTLLTNFFKDRFLQIIMDMNVEDTEDPDEGEQRDVVRYTTFRTYGSLDQVEEALMDGDATSIIIMKDNSMYVSLVYCATIWTYSGDLCMIGAVSLANKIAYSSLLTSNTRGIAA